MPAPFGDGGDPKSACRIPICFLLRQKCPYLLIARSARRKIAEKFSNPLDRFADRLAAGGVGKPQIALAVFAKAGAADRCHPRLFEQPSLQCAGVAARPGDIGKSVEGAARLSAAKPG